MSKASSERVLAAAVWVTMLLSSALAFGAARLQPSAAHAVDPASELALLQLARSLLERDPGAALGLALEHAHRHEHGMFAQEREVLVVESLLHLGKHLEAAAVAATFLTRYPESVHAARVRQLREHAAEGG